MAEWFKAAVLKTAVGESSPWVRIPPCPPPSWRHIRSPAKTRGNRLPALSKLGLLIHYHGLETVYNRHKFIEFALGHIEVIQ